MLSNSSIKWLYVWTIHIWLVEIPHLFSISCSRCISTNTKKERDMNLATLVRETLKNVEDLFKERWRQKWSVISWNDLITVCNFVLGVCISGQEEERTALRCCCSAMRIHFSTSTIEIALGHLGGRAAACQLVDPVEFFFLLIVLYEHFSRRLSGRQFWLSVRAGMWDGMRKQRGCGCDTRGS